jgi:DNA-binding transcriptional MerR regulator
MRPSEASALLHIPASTLRNWSTEYRDFLSPMGGSNAGRWRSFTDTDLKVLNHINTLKRTGFTAEEVYKNLQQLQAEEWLNLPALPNAQPTANNVPVVPTAAAEAALSSERRALLHEIQSLQQRVETLEKQLADEQVGRRTDLAASLREVAELRERIGEMNAELNLWRSGRLKPE